MPNRSIADFAEGRGALLTTAIQAAGYMRRSLEERCALTAEERFREEDPFTDRWVDISDNRIVGLRSRFEVDLNRPLHKAVYQKPEDAWGLTVWRTPLPPEEVEASLGEHVSFYTNVARSIDRLLGLHPRVVVFDFHSYNHQRGGPGKLDDQAKNPEFNIGTGNMDRITWAPVVDALMTSLREPWNGEKEHDVRENVKFQGGYFTQWLHERYGSRVCPIAIEVKKVFMDEWTGIVDPNMTTRIKSMFARSVEPVMQAAHALEEAR